jgi:hypothetical protein
MTNPLGKPQFLHRAMQSMAQIHLITVSSAWFKSSFLVSDPAVSSAWFKFSFLVNDPAKAKHEQT